jgi:hypothetical protein
MFCAHNGYATAKFQSHVLHPYLVIHLISPIWPRMVVAFCLLLQDLMYPQSPMFHLKSEAWRPPLDYPVHLHREGDDRSHCSLLHGTDVLALRTR